MNELDLIKKYNSGEISKLDLDEEKEKYLKEVLKKYNRAGNHDKIRNKR